MLAQKIPPLRRFGGAALRPFDRRGYSRDRGDSIVRSVFARFRRLFADTRGGVFVEYILLLTIVGLGAIVGLAVLRTALIDELKQLAQAIYAII